MPNEYIPLRDMSRAQRMERKARQRADAEKGMREHEQKQRELYENLERLRALRLAEETQLQAK